MKYNSQGTTGRDAVRAGAPISVTIEVATRGAQAPTFTLQPSDIIQNSVTLDMAGTSGSDLELGCCMASQFSFAVQESQNWNAMTFAGAYIHAVFSWDAGNNNTAVMDVFRGVIDEVRKENGAYTCIALDDMVQLDKQYDPHEVGSLWWQRTYLQAAQDMIRAVLPGATFGYSTYYSLVNENVGIGKATDPMLDEDGNVIEVTYRQILSWLCQVMGTACMIDPRYEDSFYFKWYAPLDPLNVFDLPTSDRYSSTRAIAPISFTGIKVTDCDNEYLYGTDSYVLALEDNPFFTASNYTSLLTNVLPRLQLAYYPMSASLVQMPYVEPFDVVNYYDVGSNSPVRSIVTNATITANGAVNIEGKGESAEIKGYASLNPMTAAQQAVIDSINEHLAEQKEQYTSSEEALLALNNVIANALGLYVTEVPQVGGGSIYYFHDAPTLADSTYIFTMTSGGFAYTNHWDGDQTVWTGGIDRNGNAVINMLTLYKLYADYIVAGTLSSHDGTFKFDLDDNEMTCTGSASVDERRTITINGESIQVVGSSDLAYVTLMSHGDIVAGLRVASDSSPLPYSVLGISGSGNLTVSVNFNRLLNVDDFWKIIRADFTEQTITEYLDTFTDPAQRAVVAVRIAAQQYLIIDRILEDYGGIILETYVPNEANPRYTTLDYRGLITHTSSADTYKRKDYKLPLLGGCYTEIPSNADLDDAHEPGEYAVLSYAVASSVSNIPKAVAGRLTVRESNGVEWEEANATNRYIIQEYAAFNGTGSWTRAGSSTNSGSTWTFDSWQPLGRFVVTGELDTANFTVSNLSHTFSQTLAAVNGGKRPELHLEYSSGGVTRRAIIDMSRYNSTTLSFSSSMEINLGNGNGIHTFGINWTSSGMTCDVWLVTATKLT